MASFDHQGADGTLHSGPGGLFPCAACDHYNQQREEEMATIAEPMISDLSHCTHCARRIRLAQTSDGTYWTHATTLNREC